MKHNSCIFLIVALFSYALQAQDQEDPYEKGLAQFYDNNFKAALGTFEAAKDQYLNQEDSLNAANCMEMIGACYNKLGRDYLSKYEEAEALYDAIGIANLHYAVVKNRIGKYHESIEILRKLETDSWTLCWMGTNYKELGKLDSAIFYFTEAMPYPRDRLEQWPFKGLAMAYSDLGDYNTSEKYFEMAISKTPSSDTVQLFDTYTRMGEMYLQQGKPWKAIDAFVEIPILLESNFASVKRNREGLRAAETQARIKRNEILIGIVLILSIGCALIIYTNWKRTNSLRIKLSYIEEYSSMLSTMLGFAKTNIKHQNLDEAEEDVKTAQKMLKEVKERTS